MKTEKVIIVRIYLTESEKITKTIIDYLNNEANIRGVTIFRAISGHGDSGTHDASWISLSLNLPITIEFFDHPDKIHPVLTHLNTLVAPEHIVYWEGLANEPAT